MRPQSERAFQPQVCLGAVTADAATTGAVTTGVARDVTIAVVLGSFLLAVTLGCAGAPVAGSAETQDADRSARTTHSEPPTAAPPATPTEPGSATQRPAQTPAASGEGQTTATAATQAAPPSTVRDRTPEAAPDAAAGAEPAYPPPLQVATEVLESHGLSVLWLASSPRPTTPQTSATERSAVLAIAADTQAVYAVVLGTEAPSVKIDALIVLGMHEPLPQPSFPSVRSVRLPATTGRFVEAAALVLIEPERRREQLVVVVPGVNEPVVVRFPREAAIWAQPLDADGDGFEEPVRFSRVFEAPAQKEVLLDLYEWTGTELRVRATHALLRRTNAFLEDLAAEIESENAPAVVAQRLSRNTVSNADALFGPTDQAPPFSSRGYPRRAIVPRLNDLNVELNTYPWAVEHEIAVADAQGAAVYRVRITFDAAVLTDKALRLAPVRQQD